MTHARRGAPPGGTSAAGKGQERRPAPRWLLPSVLAALSAGVVVGAFNPAPHTGGDNAAYVSLAYSMLEDGTYTEVFDPAAPRHTKYPPVFPALLAVLVAAGVRTWSGLKLVAALSTVAVTVLTYLWAERRLGPWWAAGIALVVTLGSASVYYSHWILSDPTFVALTLLSLWALDRAGAAEVGRRWLALGVIAAGLAYFTRSAGLPLLIAIGGWLALGKRWRWLGASAVLLGPPIALWLLRARGAGQGEYVSEFWLVDPYDPALGRVGPAGLVGRVASNLVGYVGTHLPGGIVGGRGAALVLLGALIAGLAVAGWLDALRRSRPGPAELFLPLYAGLLLLWPVVWSGDRFVLPLYPVLFLYVATFVSRWGRLFGRRAPALVGAVLLVAIALPQAGTFGRAAREGAACRAMTRVGGPFACYGPRVGAFAEAAAWAGSGLPDGSAVLTRKPRLFFVLSGVPSRTFPFSEDAADHLDLADAVGARYELLDEWDGLAARYVAGAVRERPGAFCAVRGFGDAQRTQLLGVLPVAERGTAADRAEDGVRIGACDGGYVHPDAPASAGYSSGSSRIPLLERLDR